MKDMAQRKLMAEYESRKDEFSSIVEFINAKAEESPTAKLVREKIARAKAKQ